MATPLTTSIWTLLFITIISSKINYFCEAKAKNYRNWRVVSIGPVSTQHQVQALKDFLHDYDTSNQVQVLSDVVSYTSELEIAVSPYELSHVKSYLEATSIPYVFTSDDLQQSLSEELKQNDMAFKHARRRRRSVPEDDSVELPHYFMLCTQINDYMVRVVAASRGRAELFNIGHSYEGRPMFGVKVNNGTDKPKVWLDAGIHAREWIAPATALHILHQLVFNESTSVRSIADTYQWIILPLANPDGYHFTWIEDRMWRKNRRVTGRCPDPCQKGVGVDLNRNFDFNWAKDANMNPCSQTFPGISPFSEPEARNMRAKLMEERHHMHVYISLHSFMQLWVVPWAGLLRRSPDYPELERVANESSRAIYEVHGKVYQVVNFPEQLYLASGSSMDWAKKTANIKYSYTIELRPNTRQKHFAISFQLQPSQIKPTGEEVLAGILKTASLVRQRMKGHNEN